MTETSHTVACPVHRHVIDDGCPFCTAVPGADGAGMALHFLPTPDPSGARLVEGLEGVTLNAAAIADGVALNSAAYPIAVTDAMLAAGREAWGTPLAITDDVLTAIYRAMVLAGPSGELEVDEASLETVEIELPDPDAVSRLLTAAQMDSLDSYYERALAMRRGADALTDKVIMDDPLAAAPFDAAKAKAWWNMASPKYPAMQSGGESVRMSDADLKAVITGDVWRRMLDAQAYAQFPGYLVDANGVDWLERHPTFMVQTGGGASPAPGESFRIQGQGGAQVSPPLTDSQTAWKGVSIAFNNAPMQAAGIPMGGYGTMGYPKPPNDAKPSRSNDPCAPHAVAGNSHAGHDWDLAGLVCLRCNRTRVQIEDNLWPGDPVPQGMSAKITTPTAAAYRCPDCNAAEGEWHKRLCLVGAEIVRAPK